MFTPKKCPPDCIYVHMVNGNLQTCGYIFQAHQMRGCDPGPGCKRYVGSKAKRNKLRRATWDAAKGKRMWLDGCSDGQIARALGAKRDTVASYRRRVWEMEGCAKHGIKPSDA